MQSHRASITSTRYLRLPNSTLDAESGLPAASAASLCAGEEAACLAQQG